MKLLGNDYSDRVTPDYTRAWAEQMLCELEAHLPRMRRTSQARDFWKWFRGEVASLDRHLPPEERAAARCRIDCLLRRHQ